MLNLLQVLHIENTTVQEEVDIIKSYVDEGSESFRSW